MKGCLYIVTFLLTAISISIFANQESALSLKDVRIIMEKMLSYHVEDKELSPRIIKRSLKLYIEQFDPEKLYLMKDEIETFLSVDPSLSKEMLQDYYYDRFSQYSQLHHVIQRAIYRQQKIREKQINQLIKRGAEALSQDIPLSYPGYSSTMKELKNRIFNHLLLQLKKHVKRSQKASLTPELIQKVLQYRERKNRSHETPYLNSSEHTLALHILKAMAKSLDAHTGYYTPKEAFDICAALKKELLGIGVVLREDYDGVFISGLVDDGPAQRSGQIMIGDSLCSVNDCRVEDVSFIQLTEIMKGRAGERITLGIKRKSTDQSITYVELVREKVIMNSERLYCVMEPYGGGLIGKITIPSFYDNGEQVSVDKDLNEAVKALRSQGEIKGIVLDLRKNSGGFLTQAIKVSSFFMHGGLIAISKYRDGKVKCMRNVGAGLFHGPLVVLISKASASAAEIVAQALQDYGVALIVGDTRSYGKGSMQYQTLTDGKAQAFFTVTVGRYYTASGRSPQIVGVQADIVVPTIFSSYNIGEKYLEFPLANDHLSEDAFHFLMHIDQQFYRKGDCLVVPYLKPHRSQWRHMLSKLSLNSKERLRRDRNFQLFLQAGNGPVFNYGVEDLQIKESVEILKDMILLHSTTQIRN